MTFNGFLCKFSQHKVLESLSTLHDGNLAVQTTRLTGGPGTLHDPLPGAAPILSNYQTMLDHQNTQNDTGNDEQKANDSTH